jgi:glycosyltransferase involved in cell wall biosynthesis
MTPDLSVVVPLRDEALNVEPLYDELTRALAAVSLPYEVILVEDGSVDSTFEKLAALHARDARIRVIRFARNFGQTAAFAAGFAYARGQWIATMDGDLQNNPADIPRLLRIAQTKDIVCGWRKERKDAFLTRHVPSVIANWLLSQVTGLHLHDNGCSLKVYRAAVVKPLRLRQGMHRYLPALASQMGPRVDEVVVDHRPRRYGRSKYGLSRTLRVIVDLIQLRSLMRRAIDPSTPGIHYEIAEILESEPGDTRAARHRVN